MADKAADKGLVADSPQKLATWPNFREKSAVYFDFSKLLCTFAPD